MCNGLIHFCFCLFAVFSDMRSSWIPSTTTIFKCSTVISYIESKCWILAIALVVKSEDNKLTWKLFKANRKHNASNKPSQLFCDVRIFPEHNWTPSSAGGSQHPLTNLPKNDQKWVFIKYGHVIYHWKTHGRRF